jgi:tetratricopeptide (TPR) repeat protein
VDINTSQPITIFYSYAQRDELLRNELEKHLSNLRRQGIITEWHDRQIIAGTNWAQAIDAHLTTASTDNTELNSLNKTDIDQAEAIVTAMDGLPLALDQAGAYIEETRCSLSDYLNIYRMQRSNLLQQRGQLSIGHPDPVATTWSLSFQEIERTNRAAADLLRLCAFLSPDSIPEELITAGSADLGGALKSIAADLFKFSEAMREVLRYSLLQRDARSKTLSVHRLVQAVVKDGMNQRTQQLWAERAVRAINRVFPTNEVQYWPLCQQYLPHVQECITHINQWNMIFSEAAQLLDHAGVYLYKRGLYTEAKPLLDQALTIYKQALGTAHLTTVMCINNLALLYEAQGQYDQAKALYQQAIDISERVEGSKHPFTADALYVLAQFYLNQDQYIQAEPLLRWALAIYQNVFGPAHPLPRMHLLR